MLSNYKWHFLKPWSVLLKRAISTRKVKFIVLCLLFAGLFCKRSKTPTSIVYTLTPEQVYFNSSPDQVLRVFKEERFASRANFQEPLIEVRSLNTLLIPHPNFTFDATIHILLKVLARRTYLTLFRSINKEISILDNDSNLKLKSFKEHLLDPIIYAKLFSREANSIDLITTQSSFFKVPSAFKVMTRPKKIMAWYSTNSKPIFASGDIQRKDINVGAFNEFVNEHWVWNKQEVNFLESCGVSNVIAVGPVIFQDKIMDERDPNKFVITYFDVTPYQGSGEFYSELNTTLVLTNILRLIDFLEAKYPNLVIVRIKPKRKYSRYHSKDYISAVSTASKQMKIKCLSASSNLYQTISQSDLVLAIPFTSPALLARDLKVNSYFVSTGIDGWDVPTSSAGIPVIFQFEELLNHVEKEIERKFNF
jgi:polysaccharide biosynthesis PFTS motif protein